jgi:hypothetical protein
VSRCWSSTVLKLTPSARLQESFTKIVERRNRENVRARVVRIALHVTFSQSDTSPLRFDGLCFVSELSIDGAALSDDW